MGDTFPKASGTEPDSTTSMLIGAGVIFLCSLIPQTAYLFFLPPLGAVLLTLYHFISTNKVSPTYGAGAKLGMLTVLVGCLLAILVTDFIWLLFDYELGADTAKQMALWIVDSIGGAQVETVKRQMEKQFIERAATGITPWIVIGQLLSSAITAALFGSLGGALGVALFDRGDGVAAP